MIFHNNRYMKVNILNMGIVLYNSFKVGYCFTQNVWFLLLYIIIFDSRDWYIFNFVSYFLIVNVLLCNWSVFNSIFWNVICIFLFNRYKLWISMSLSSRCVLCINSGNLWVIDVIRSRGYKTFFSLNISLFLR